MTIKTNLTAEQRSAYALEILNNPVFNEIIDALAMKYFNKFEGLKEDVDPLTRDYVFLQYKAAKSIQTEFKGLLSREHLTKNRKP